MKISIWLCPELVTGHPPKLSKKSELSKRAILLSTWSNIYENDPPFSFPTCQENWRCTKVHQIGSFPGPALVNYQQMIIARSPKKCPSYPFLINITRFCTFAYQHQQEQKCSRYLRLKFVSFPGTFFILYDFIQYFKKDNPSFLPRSDFLEIIEKIFGEQWPVSQLEKDAIIFQVIFC